MPDTKYMENAEKYRLENSKLSDDDIKTYNMNKGKYYKGTIAVCAIYGAFALFLLLILMFSDKGSSFLSNDFRAFCITFITGLVLIVIFLVITITSSKPFVLKAPAYDKDMCPDYWHLEKTPDTDFDKVANGKFASLDAGEQSTLRYKCVPNTTLGSIGDATISSANTGSGSSEVKGLPQFYNGSTVHPALIARGTNDAGISNTLNCNAAYPNYLAMKSLKDKTNNPNGQKNKFACDYAKKCNIAWTSACPEVTY